MFRTLFKKNLASQRKVDLSTRTGHDLNFIINYFIVGKKQ